MIPHDYNPALDHARRLADTFLQELHLRRVTPEALPPAPMPPDGVGLDRTFALLASEVAPYLSASPGPRYLGFVTGGVTPEALAADWLASAWDQNLSSRIGSIAADLEDRTVAAYAGIFGLEPVMHGQFVSGATMANLVGMATARQWAYRVHGELPTGIRRIGTLEHPQGHGHHRHRAQPARIDSYPARAHVRRYRSPAGRVGTAPGTGDRRGKRRRSEYRRLRRPARPGRYLRGHRGLAARRRRVRAFRGIRR